MPNDSVHQYPFYSPRFWHGMMPRAWWNLLRLGGFRIRPSRFGMVVAVSIATLVNVALTFINWLLFHRKLDQTEIDTPPLFIIGHWRSGTTLLHELLVIDKRLSSPSTFQCFAPHHFLTSQWFFHQFGSWLLPNQRPMDNMAAGWDRPQEDEFALVNLGLPSPYRRIAFPDQPPPDLDYLDTESLAESERQTWVRGLKKFLTAVTYHTGRPLVVKSPTHTGRIATLAAAFPGAKFIHISRDPRALFPSTKRLWRSLEEGQALGSTHEEQLDEYVIECLQRMYTAYDRDRSKIEPSHLLEIRYEDLIAAPVEQLEAIYAKLRLGDFDSVREPLTQWAETQHRDYKTNQHRLPEEDEKLIREQWLSYFERYGYYS